jgi:hypothetical protein
VYLAFEAGELLRRVRWEPKSGSDLIWGLKLTRNAVFVAESLELTVGPGIEDPVLDSDPALLSLVAGLIPRSLDLGNQRIL